MAGSESRLLAGLRIFEVGDLTGRVCPAIIHLHMNIPFGVRVPIVTEGNLTSLHKLIFFHEVNLNTEHVHFPSCFLASLGESCPSLRVITNSKCNCSDKT